MVWVLYHNYQGPSQYLCFSAGVYISGNNDGWGKMKEEEKKGQKREKEKEKKGAKRENGKGGWKKGPI